METQTQELKEHEVKLGGKVVTMKQIASLMYIHELHILLSDSETADKAGYAILGLQLPDHFKQGHPNKPKMAVGKILTFGHQLSEFLLREGISYSDLVYAGRQAVAYFEAYTAPKLHFFDEVKEAENFTEVGQERSDS